jgi:hypothetical protein
MFHFVCSITHTTKRTFSFRGSKSITLTSKGFYYDTARFLSKDLATLTDQNPVRVEFAWSLTSTLRQSDLYGGPHGCVDRLLEYLLS